MQFPSTSQQFIRILFASTALVVLSFCTVARAQPGVNLVIGSDIELEQGTQGEIPIFLNSFGVQPGTSGVIISTVDLFVEADLLMPSEVGFDSTDSIFGDFSTTISAASEDLFVDFSGPVSVSGPVPLGSLVLDTSRLSAGDEITLSFDGSQAFNFVPIDNLLAPTSDVTVTIVSSVPEPSACCLLTVLSVTVFSRRRRR